MSEQIGLADAWTVTCDVVDEVDDFVKSIAGVDVDAVRTGVGVGPSEVLAARGDRFTLTSCSVGFPMRSRATIPDDRVVIATISTAPRGSRWCEIDLRPGSLIIYGPGTEHTAVDIPGLQYTFVITPVERLAETADLLRLPVVMPAAGEVRELEITDRTRHVAPALTSFAEVAKRGCWSLLGPAHRVMRAMTRAITEEGRQSWRGGGRAIDSRRVVHACIDYANATRRIPSIGELCLAAHVSERTLRVAFAREFDLPPSRYFHNWALQAAHRRLRDADPAEHSVAEIATDVGFGHLGRFSGNYRALYGEMPSTTLRTPTRYAA